MSSFFKAYHKARELKKAKKKASIQSGSWIHPFGQTNRQIRLRYDMVKKISHEYPKYGEQYARQIMNSNQPDIQQGGPSLKQRLANMDTVQLIVYTILILGVLAIIIFGAYLAYQ